jgi:hypothetical protein
LANLILNGSTSGSVTLSSPAVSGTTTLTLPTTSGTVLTSGTNTNFPTGSIVQVVYASTTTEFTTTSTTLQNTGFSASITPTSSSNKILVISNNSMYVNINGQGTTFVYCRASLARGSTQLQEQRMAMNTGLTSVTDIAGSPNITYLDSPATTSSVTYRIYVSALTTSFSTTFASQGASSLTLIEVKA